MTDTRIPDLVDKIAKWKEDALAAQQERDALVIVLEETVDRLRIATDEAELMRRAARANAETARLALEYVVAYKAVTKAAAEFCDTANGQRYASETLKATVKDLEKCPIASPKA